MADAWRLTVVVQDASGTPVSAAQLVVTVWSGGATIERRPPVVVDGTALVVVDAAAQGVVLQLRHDRFAPLAMVLVRAPSETVWRWTDPNRIVRTSGREVFVAATMGRLRFVPDGFRAENELVRRAADAMRPAVEAARRRRRKPPAFVIADADLRVALTSQNRTGYRSALASLGQVGQGGRVDAFHVARPELLGADPSAPGWERLASTAQSVDPAQQGRLHFLEYGEVGDSPSMGPRYAVGVWVPTALSRPEVRQLDMIVWLHPNTNNPDMLPQVEYPFGRPYPYGLLAVGMGENKPPAASQRFLDIPAFHLFSQHFLAYQMFAAHKSAVIVIPVAPSNHFEPFEAPGTLMRLLRELCCFLPRDLPRGGEARVHPAPPIERGVPITTCSVGRVVVAGFSVSVPRIATLMNASIPDGHYAEAIWGTRSDITAFADVWKEQWAIDGVATGFSTYLNLAASWVGSRHGRRLRVYKSDHTGGRWLPLQVREGPWASLVRGSRPITRSAGKLWAQWTGDSNGLWQAASFSNDFLLGPASGPAATMQPKLGTSGIHELMPRVCFGHAAVTSGLTGVA